MPLTTAVNVQVFPRITVTELGLTTTEVTVGAGIFTAAVPKIFVNPDTVDVARTVRLEEVSPDATLKRPEEFIVVEELLLPVTLQVTLCEG